MSSQVPNRQYELCTCVTPDEVKLHGMYQAADSPPSSTLDAALVLHGLGSNFYSSTLNLRLADALIELGIPVVLGNTRGHDGISMNPVSGRAQTIGAAYEIIDDCRHDIAGWVNWLAGRKGHARVALVGHSLGAIKSLYAEGCDPQVNVSAIVGLSATRLCHGKFLESPRADDFRKWYRLAADMVEQGRGQELLHVDFPFPLHISAQAYTDKYGPADRYDWLPLAGRIGVPVLLMFGERELRDNAAFHGLREEVSTVTGPLPKLSVEIIASANHYYAGVHHRATEAMQQWIERNFAAD